MENWKRGLLAGAAGVSVILLLKGYKSGALLAAGVGLAALASEYPEEFADFRENLPQYFERGTSYLDMVSRAGEKLADVAGSRGSEWYEALVRG